MSKAITNFTGKIHGKTIELDQEPGLPEGQIVSVTVRPSTFTGEGLRRSFGAWADDAEGLDEFLEQLRKNRKIDRPDIEP